MVRTVPVLNPGAWWGKHQRAISESVGHVLGSGQVLLGHQTKALEEELGEYLARECVLFSSGSMALIAALEVVAEIGLGEPTPIGVPPNCPPAVINAIRCVDRTADIEVSTGAPPLWVHMYGHCDLVGALEHAPMVEDCSHSLGTQCAGSMAAAQVISFYPTKPLGAVGDCGAVAVRDSSLARELKVWRNCGADPVSKAQLRVAPNARPDELQAGVLRVLLRHLDHRNEIVADLVEEYRRMLPRDVQLRGTDHRHLMVVDLGDRWQVTQRMMAAAQVETAWHYPSVKHTLASMRDRSRRFWARGSWQDNGLLTLPLWPGLEVRDVARVCDVLQAALELVEDRGD